MAGSVSLRDGRRRFSRRAIGSVATAVLVALLAGAVAAHAQTEPAPALEFDAELGDFVPDGGAEGGSGGAVEGEASADAPQNFNEAVSRILLRTLVEPTPPLLDPAFTGDTSPPETERGGDAAAEGDAPALGPSGGGDGPLTSICVAPEAPEPLNNAVMSAFALRVEDAWDRPEIPDPSNPPTVVLEVCLGANGELLSRPRLIRPVGALEPEQSMALLSALDALEKAAPFRGPPERYLAWRRILVLFDPLKGRDTAEGSEEDPADGGTETP